MGDRVGRPRGRWLNSAGKVLLIPQSVLLRRDGFIRQTNCGDRGKCEILDVRPGEYCGFAVAPDDPAGKPGALDQDLTNQSLRVSVRSTNPRSPTCA